MSTGRTFNTFKTGSLFEAMCCSIKSYFPVGVTPRGRFQRLYSTINLVSTLSRGLSPAGTDGLKNEQWGTPGLPLGSVSACKKTMASETFCWAKKYHR